MLAIVCPGQGSQTPGLLAPWLERPGAVDRLAWFSAVTGVDLIEHGTRSDADTIRDTAIAQPLIVATGLLSADALGTLPPRAVLAGHSVGEYTAAALSGVLTAEQALVLVRERGLAMATAGAAEPTGMSAVLGGDPDEVAAALAAHGLVAANANGGGQVVAAGTLEALAALAAAPPARARVKPLQVAGAFHTHYMASAVAVLEPLARTVVPGEPAGTLLSNADGAAVDGPTALSRLVSQVSNPVRWDACMATMAELGVTALLEMSPGGALVGLAKRALPGVRRVALSTPDDLPAARELLEEFALVGADVTAGAA